MHTKVLIISLFFWVGMVSIKAISIPEDLLGAMTLCDETDLAPIEGLWTYPDDDVTVLIYRNAFRKGVYDITVIESSDCSLSTGMQIGELSQSADVTKFNLKLYTSAKKGLLKSPQEAIATFSESGESLIVKKSSPKVRINPSRLLPYFWRIVSVSFNSDGKAPEGMIKIYPSYDGNGSTRRLPRYL